MIFIVLIVLATVALTPLALVLARGGLTRGRRDAALALHRAQLDELDRELAEGRIGQTEHATAVLEVKRRLLAAAEIAEPEILPGAGRSGRWPLLVALVVIPLAAGGLYAIHGRWDLPDVPLSARIAEETANAQRDETLIRTLRQRLSEMDPTSDMARQGYVLLGNAESTRGNLAEAAAAWQVALDQRFDPTLAAQIAEAHCLIESRVSESSAALFRRALAEGPKDAPWREVAEQRLAQAAQQ
jgi:cytochrome c-type biogenesis protein CcmH